MDHIVLSLGSNLGDRFANLETARKKLENRGINVVRQSTVYETEPYGYSHQDNFLNQAVVIETHQSPENLIQSCLDIEDDMGRIRGVKNGPRNIDIDLLFYKNQQLDYSYLQVPHPQLHKRNCILGPLEEIVPDQMHPRFRKSIRSLKEECPDELGAWIFDTKPASKEKDSQENNPQAHDLPMIHSNEPQPLPKETFDNWIRSFGDDPTREGLQDTHRRFTESRQDLFAGYHQDPMEAMTLFDSEGYDEMIICRDIDFFSNCEHHILPFYGRAHIGYIPGEKIIGLSKFSRVIEVYARRLQNQERLTTQVADFLFDVLQPKGLGIILEAEHLCIKSRGADKQNAFVTTSSFKGFFKSRPETRAEFLNLVAKKKA